MSNEHNAHATVPLYGVKVHLCITADMTGAVKKLGGDIASDDEAEAWTVDMGGGKWAMVFDINNLQHGAIAHEMSHMVDFIFAYIDHTPAKEGDESRSYLADWLANWVYCSLESFGLTPKTCPLNAH